MNRNKRSITLDLKKDEGRQIFYKMVETADVVVQNFRVGVAERIGIEYESLVKVNPKIICASATGFGRKGPEATNGVFDILGIARGGAMRSLQYPDSELVYTGGFGMADQTGAMVLAHAITMALLARERFGVGQDVEISQLGAQFLLQHMGITRYLITGGSVPPARRLDVFNPLFSVYECEGSKWLALACLQADRHWKDICEVLELGELETDPRFVQMNERNANGRELVPILDRVFASKPRESWLKALGARRVPCSPVNDYSDLAEDVQVRANEYLVEMEHPEIGTIQEVGVPIHMSRTPGRVRNTAPQLGQHTEEVLLEHGFDWDQIQKFREAAVI
jgi:formyl-CoA transferase